MLTFVAVVLLLIAAQRADRVSRLLQRTYHQELLGEGMELSHWIDERMAERYWLWRRFCIEGAFMAGFAVAAVGAYALNGLTGGTVLCGLVSGWQFVKMTVAGYRLSRV